MACKSCSYLNLKPTWYQNGQHFNVSLNPRVITVKAFINSRKNLWIARDSFGNQTNNICKQTSRRWLQTDLIKTKVSYQHILTKILYNIVKCRKGLWFFPIWIQEKFTWISILRRETKSTMENQTHTHPFLQKVLNQTNKWQSFTCSFHNKPSPIYPITHNVCMDRNTFYGNLIFLIFTIFTDTLVVLWTSENFNAGVIQHDEFSLWFLKTKWMQTCLNSKTLTLHHHITKHT